MGFDDLRGFTGTEIVPVLRELHWGEFCARLSAAQDLRRLAQAVSRAAKGSPVRASFHPEAARMLLEPKHEGAVNPTSSTNGKVEESTKVMKPRRPSPPPYGGLTRRELS
ncbi:MAG TPA: hypothetical protein EYH41_12010 [Novosphingobium capsulatum]|nr:hypothetical protein [Novosphingobium aromaticivorans]HIQ18689.1 hypothetical protein [Novosphingobium capsulatum]